MLPALASRRILMIYAYDWSVPQPLLPVLMKIRIPHQPAHIFLFLLLAFLCYQAHQFVRHLGGAGLCGGFGSMTFTVATTKQPCTLATVVTLSGPVLTFAPGFTGMRLLYTRRFALSGYALIFAGFAHLRFIQTRTGQGDEPVLAQHRNALWIISGYIHDRADHRPHCSHIVLIFSPRYLRRQEKGAQDV